jgi:putative transcriptional regulator
MKSLAGALLAVALLAFPAGASAQEREESEAVVLVATAMLNDSSYRRTVILALPIDGGQHIGIVLNRPSRRTLADLFPEHEPSKKVTEPVFFGGPMSQRAIFALVRSDENPGRGTLRIMQGMFLAITASIVDHIIELWPQQARFYAGDVIWRPGELSEELGNGYWHVMNAHPDLMFRKDTQGLWDELSRFAGALSADAGHAMHRARSAR